MNNLSTLIDKANADEIPELLLAVIQRYIFLFPEWEISTISIDKTIDRNTQLDQMIKTLEAMKTFP